MTTATDDNAVDTSTEASDNSFLEMSDEEVMKMAGPPAVVEPQAEAGAAGTADTGTEEKPAEGSDATGSGEGQDAGGGGQETTPAAAGTGEGDVAAEAGPKDPAKQDGAAAGTEAEAKNEDKPAGSTEEAKPIDYEAEYKRILAPFRANGREIKVESVDDALALMQMGANYNKKMAALKPNLKLLKMLENNGLLSEDKLSFLIDLDKKDPGAINKLVKESGIDPLELDAEKAGAYKQPSYAVDDKTVELDTVLDEISDSPTYTKTLDVVGNKWDAVSKQAIAATPQLLKVIDSHMASGIYDLISAGIERERMLGRLNGMSDIDAYKAVGDAIQARGGFNHLFEKQESKTTPAAPVVVTPKPKADESALDDKRRAASPPRAAGPAKAPVIDPLGMSDEEFEKQAALRYR